MQKPNYAFKAQVISQGWTDVERDISYSLYSNSFPTQNKSCKYNLETALELRSLFYLDANFKDSYLEAEKINHASYQRTKKLKSKIATMLDKSDCCFLTMTFDDHILSTTTNDTRRRYISRFLRSLGVPYIANKDFGKQNHREHYHAVIQSPRLDLNSYSYGFIFAETVYRAKDTTKLAKYIAKLTNHAIKETTKRSVIMYSR